MSEGEAEKFSCANCGKQYRWSERVAGKTARCSCGWVIDVPLTMSADEIAPEDDDGLPAFDSYDVAHDDNAPPAVLKPLVAAPRAEPSSAVAVPSGVMPFAHRSRAAAVMNEPDQRNFKQIEVTLPLLMVVGGMFGFALAIVPVFTGWNETHRLTRLVVKICAWISAGMLLLIIGGVLLQMYNVRGDTRPDGQSTMRWTLIRVLGGTGLVIVGVGIMVVCVNLGWPDRYSIMTGMSCAFPGLAMIARTLAPRY